MVLKEFGKFDLTRLGGGTLSLMFNQETVKWFKSMFESVDRDPYDDGNFFLHINCSEYEPNAKLSGRSDSEAPLER